MIDIRLAQGEKIEILQNLKHFMPQESGWMFRLVKQSFDGFQS